MSATETWTDDGERFAVIDYDERGVAEVTREVMHMLLDRAGFEQAEMPPPTEYVPGAGRERLRRAHLRATTPPTDTASAAGGGDRGE